MEINVHLGIIRILCLNFLEFTDGTLLPEAAKVCFGHRPTPGFKGDLTLEETYFIILIYESSGF